MSQHLPALGQPASGPTDEPTPDRDADFAGEHDSTVVDKDVTADREHDTEAETPEGWSGLDGDGPP
jgi:hypothetical protein